MGNRHEFVRRALILKLENRMRPRLHWVLFAALLSLPSLTTPVEAQEHPTLGVHHSEQFGVLIWWDPIDWSVEMQQVDDGTEYLELESDLGNARYEAYALPGVTPKRCVEDLLHDMQANEAISDIWIEWTEDVEQPSEPSSGTVSALFLYQEVIDDETAGRRRSVTCREIEAGQSALRASSVYEANAAIGEPVVAQLDRYVLLGGAHHALVSTVSPEPAWNRLPVLAQFPLTSHGSLTTSNPQATASVRLRDQLSRDYLEATRLGPLPPGSRYVELTVDLVNIEAPVSLRVGPQRFFLQDLSSTIYPPSTADWVRGPGELDREELDLTVGESARLRLFFVLPDDAVIEAVACRCFFSDQSAPTTPGSNHLSVGPDLAYPPLPPLDLSRVPVLTREGDELAAITVLGTVNTQLYRRHLVLVENTGPDAFTVNPGQFRSINLTRFWVTREEDAGNLLPTPPVFEPTWRHGWVYGAQSHRGPHVLGPREFALLEVDIAPWTDLYFLPRPNQPILVNEAP